MHPDWLTPVWPAPAQVHALCTTRAGGQSVGPYDSLNLGAHVGDAPGDVQSNRGRLAQALGARPVFMSQVHGCELLELDRNTGDGHAADACYTQAPGLACTIMVADCLPVLCTDEQGSFVAAAHAGWRGLAGIAGRGVLEVIGQRLLARAGQGRSPAADQVLVWLGPCIGPQAFVVGPEVRAVFVAQDAGAADCFAASVAGRWLADLPGLARRRLRAMGLTRLYGNDGSVEWCTAGNRARFYSHRRDGVSGRMAASICLR